MRTGTDSRVCFCYIDLLEGTMDVDWRRLERTVGVI